MREEEFETSIKVLLVGNGAVGKSSMIQRYCKGVFTKDYKKTIGVDFLERQIQVRGEDVRLMLWDTAGQEEFDSITKSYYRGAHACVLAFSTTDRRSFEDVAKWRDKVAEECGDIAMVLIQNKIDLLEEAVVEPSEVEDLARSLKLKFYRTSVKDDYNIDEVFLYLAERHLEILSKMDSLETDPSGTNTIGLFSADGTDVQASANSEGRVNNSEKRNKKTRAKNDTQVTESSFQLRPNKIRTGGKKNKLMCTVL